MSSDDSFDDLLEFMEQLRTQVDEFDATREDGDQASFEEFRWGDPVAVNYHFERVLYESDQKVVLLVRHRTLDKLFAMKVLSPAASDDVAVRRLEAEAKAISRLGHENIVFVVDFGESPRVGHYYVMEYLNGDTLASRLVGGASVSVETMLDVAAHAGAALGAAHDVGLVHRDVNPANLMSHRTRDDEVWKLLDFGLASDVVRDQEALGLHANTHFVAPEVQAGSAATPFADQFSLAATLYRGLFGTVPSADRGGAPASAAPSSIPQIPEDIGDRAGLAKVFSRALASSPDDRFPHVEAFVAAFHRELGRPRKPTVSPSDIFEARRVAGGLGDIDSVAVGMSFSTSRTTHPALESIDPSGSLEVTFSELPGLRPTFTMAFRSARRLRREWRRNLIGWGAFVPTERRLKVGSPVLLDIEFRPAAVARSFPATVVGRTVDVASGLAVEIEPEHREALHEFISSLDIATFSAEMRIRKVEPSPRDALSKDEEFVLEKLTDGMTVGELRRIFANLPLPVDDVVGRLEEKKFINVSGATTDRPTRTEPETAERDDILRVIERADFLRDQGNHLGEIEMLKIAAERYRSAPLYHRLASAKLRHDYDLEGAIEMLERAVRIAPDNSEYDEQLASLRRFQTYDPNV